MLRLRKILLFDFIYYLILIICLVLTFYRLTIPIKYNYSIKDKYIEGKILNIYSDGDKLQLIIKKTEKIKCIYYFKTLKEKKYILNNINLGDNIKLKGKLGIVKLKRNEKLYNYNKYLITKNIKYSFRIENILSIKKNTNILYSIKSFIIAKCDNKYLKVFIVGDKTDIEYNVLSNYRDLGVSHLFAISGMHIGLLSMLLLKLLKRIKIQEEKRYLIVSIFLVFYLFITGFSASIFRAVLFFILFSVNKIYYFYIKSVNIFIIVLIISLLFNPYYIYDIAFLYSFSISLSLIVMGNYINSYSSYIKKLFITSLISFIVSIPITLYNFNSINFLSIIYNLFYVPFISFIVFPLSLLTFIFKVLEPIFNTFIYILESISAYLIKIDFLKLSFISDELYIYIIYIILIIIFLYGLVKRKRLLICFLPIFLFFHYTEPYIFDNDYLLMIDVGQGDSILLHTDRKNILIDTGGIMKYRVDKWKEKNSNDSIILNTTIPILRKNGIKKIDYLILTHGDFDHMGEAINLVNNFKVEKVIFNCGRYNYLERKLIGVLNKKGIKYYSCINELNLDITSLYFLQTKDFNNENDNSNVIYTEIKNYKFMFMGDASIKTEQEIIKEYSLGKIDVLKVGHHGSKTSSSKEFIDTINPKYALISVGKDNKFKHPNKEALENLKKTRIYRTDKQGSIMLKIKNNELKTETCSP